MKTNTNTTTTRAITNTDRIIFDYLITHQNPYERAQKAVYCVLRAKIRDSGLTMYIDLQNSTQADQDTAKESELFTQLTQAEQTAKTLEKTLANLKKTAEDITKTDTERTTALKDHRAQAHELKKIQSTIQALTDRLEEHRTFTNRQDLLHTAYIQDHINRTTPAPITAEHLALIGKTEDEADTLSVDEWATLQSKANFSAICKTVNKYMQTLPTAQAYDKVTKKYIPQTQEQANEWATIYGGIGKEIKVHQPRKRTRNSECFATMEHFDTKQRKGFYKVMHYITTAPITYIEQYTNEDGKSTIDNLIKYRAESHEPTAQNISTADTHKALLQEVARLNKKKTTKTQADFLSIFLSDKVEEYGDRAKQHYIEHKQGAHTTAQAEKWAYKKRLQKTFEIMCISNPTTQRTTLYKLSQKIKPRATAQSQTEPKAEPRADLIRWAEQSHQAEQIKGVIQWYTKEQAEQLRLYNHLRATAQTQQSTINNTEPTAQYYGHLAELRYIIQQATNKATAQRLTDDEIRTTIRRLEKHRAKADRKNKGKARAEQMKKARAEQDRKTAYYKTVIFNYRHYITAEQRKEFDRLPFKAQVKQALTKKGA